jgi:hypothetical protein
MYSAASRVEYPRLEITTICVSLQGITTMVDLFMPHTAATQSKFARESAKRDIRLKLCGYRQGWFHYKLVELAHCRPKVAGREVCVPQNHRDIRMTQQLAHSVQVYARHYQPAREVMPAVVKTEVFQVGDLDQRFPARIDVTHALPLRAWEYEGMGAWLPLTRTPLGEYSVGLGV